MYKLSKPQEAMFKMDRVEPMGVANITGDIIFEGEFLSEKIVAMCHSLMDSHPVFKTRIVMEENVPMQYVSEKPYEPCSILDFDSKEQYNEWVLAYAKKPLELFSQLAFLTVCRVGEIGIYVVAKLHHIIGDGWSIALIANQLNTLYNGGEIQGYPYQEYCIKEQEYLNSSKYTDDGQYWQGLFQGGGEINYLCKSTSTSYDARRSSFELDYELCCGIREFCKKYQQSEFAFFASIVGLYIYRVIQQKDFYMGIPLVNRRGKREKNTIGAFVNTIPMAFNMDKSHDFLRLIRDFKAQTIKSYRHQRYNYSDLMGQVHKKYGVKSQLFDVMLSYQNANILENKARWHFQGVQLESLIIHINDREQTGRFNLDFDYQREKFSAMEIFHMNSGLGALIGEVLENPCKELWQYSIMSEEQKKMAVGNNSSLAELAKGATVDSLFVDSAALMSDNIGAVFENKSLSFGDINSMSDRIAHRLQSLGLGVEEVVGIFVKRSLELPVILYGILKAGCAYMPIDVETPPQNLEYILKESGCRLVISMEENREYLEKYSKVLALKQGEIFTCSGSREYAVRHKGENLAYVIYTSGSSGRPKGVMIEHRSVVNRLMWMQKAYPIGAEDCILQKTPYTFDVSVWELFWGGLSGAKTCFLPHGDHKKPDKIIAAVEKTGVTLLHFVPSMLRVFLEYAGGERSYGMRSVKRVFSSGEALSPELVKKFYRVLEAGLTNLYGPTEATVDVSAFDCHKGVEYPVIPIGRAIDNTGLYILDDNNSLLPMGAAGELCIGGVCVGRGYINRPDLTEQSFVQCPFQRGRMYKTGDMARYGEDGNIQFLGRKDKQIKIHGFRIEPGEIERVALEFNGILEACVAQVEYGEKEKCICCYYRSDGEIDSKELSRHMGKGLLPYMVPRVFMKIHRFPLNISGKVDIRALPTPSPLNMGGNYAPPISANEALIVQAMEGILNVSPIGRFDDFFQLGGDSLSVISLITRLEPDISLSFDVVYKGATAKAMAEMAGVFESDSLHCYHRGKGEKCILLLSPAGSEYSSFDSLAGAITADRKDISIYGSKNSLLSEGEAKKLARELEFKIGNEKIYIYAHCAGVGTALRLYREMGEQKKNIKRFIVGGNIPPHRAVQKRQLNPWKLVSDGGIIKILTAAGGDFASLDSKAKEYIVKKFRRDIDIYLDIIGERAEKISVPLHLIIGKNDIFTKNYSKARVLWSNYFNGEITMELLDTGDHYFYMHSPQVLWGEMRKQLEDEDSGESWDK